MDLNFRKIIKQTKQSINDSKKEIFYAREDLKRLQKYIIKLQKYFKEDNVKIRDVILEEFEDEIYEYLQVTGNEIMQIQENTLQILDANPILVENIYNKIKNIDIDELDMEREEQKAKEGEAKCAEYEIESMLKKIRTENVNERQQKLINRIINPKDEYERKMFAKKMKEDPNLKEAFEYMMIFEAGSEIEKIKRFVKYKKNYIEKEDEFISNKESIQEEFFHTFETLHEAKKQIVLTSDRPPKDMLTLTERLRSRFSSGVIADVQPPEYETRCAIIKNKANSLGLDLSNEIVEFVAKKLHTNVRELEGAINHIKAYSVLNGVRPNLETAQNAIASVVSENMPSAISVDLIIDMVSRYFNISIEDIKGKKRNASIAMARQIAMFITRDMTSLSLEDVGREFGGKDHTTVLHSIKKVESAIQIDPKMDRDISELKETIRKSF